MKNFTPTIYFFVLGTILLLSTSKLHAQRMYDSTMVSTEVTEADILKNTSDGTRYYLIVGVFDTREHANTHYKFLNELGYVCYNKSSKINNWVYSYMTSSNSLQDMIQKYDEIKDIDCFSDAWILKVEGDSESMITKMEGSFTEYIFSKENK
ncbi:MAG: hypothetical protein K2X86_04770 [Cytophagaceae bacterium]|nr:hypothetical protein [Cytophagaceae bacterium]